MKAIESLGYVTPRDYTHFVRFNILKGKYYRVKAAVGIVMALIVCAFLAINGVVKGEKSYFILAGAVLLCIFMLFYTINNNVKNHCNRQPKVIRAQQKAVFGKNGFVFELLFKDEEENEHDEIFYDELEYVYDTKHAIYLYIEKRSVLIIPKRNLNMSPAEAREFLKKYIPAQKLVICV